MNTSGSPLLKRTETGAKWNHVRLFWFFFIAIILIVADVLFAEPHIGAADNGDFARYAMRANIEQQGIPITEENRYFNALCEQWNWEPFAWRILTPVRQAYSNAWSISLVRLLTNVFSDTATTPFSIFYLAVVYVLLLLAACCFLLRFAIRTFEEYSPWIVLAGIILYMGSMHLGWLNSFYGEALLYVGLLLLGGVWAELISAEHTPLKRVLLLALLCISMYLFLLAKPQGVLAYPLWAALLIYTSVVLCKKVKNAAWINPVVAVMVSFCCVWTGISCYRLYMWNGSYNERFTLYNSIMYGSLMLTDTEEEATDMLEDMGLDPSLVKDKGHYAYQIESELSVSPYSEVWGQVYEQVNTMTVLKYYLQHPARLYQAMEITAQSAIKPYGDLLQFKDRVEDQWDNELGRFTLWQWIRPYVVPHHFWQYAVAYLALFAICIRSLIRHWRETDYRMFILFFMVLMLTGIIQYPLPFIGNGYADVNKQLYLFMLCWDSTLLISAGWLLQAWRYRHRKAACAEGTV